MNFDNVPNHLRDRAWYYKDSAYTFLVDAPITLGHSQLKLLIDQNQQEEDAFQSAAKHIAECIKRLRKTLCNLRLDNWTALAQYTSSSGDYQKTLVLKVSARESDNEYKVHLIPYFSSHLCATTRLYTAVQNLEEEKTGGLLHWIGQRESFVDYDMRCGRNNEIVKSRIHSFKLPELASRLRSQSV